MAAAKTKTKKAPVAPHHKYLSEEALRAATFEALARLELERHQVELAITVHGEGVMVGDQSATEALDKIDAGIKRLETTYADILEA